MYKTVVLFFLVLSVAACNNNQSNKKQRPIIVIFLSDDQAWRDYGFMGHEIIKTPNLDKLASEALVVMSSLVRRA